MTIPDEPPESVLSKWLEIVHGSDFDPTALPCPGPVCAGCPPSSVVFLKQVSKSLAEEVFDGAVGIGGQMFEPAMVARLDDEGQAAFSRSRGCKVRFGRRGGRRFLYRWHIA